MVSAAPIMDVVSEVMWSSSGSDGGGGSECVAGARTAGPRSPGRSSGSIRRRRAYLATGSIRQTAAELFCHRNTVLKRLGRFTELTGLDIAIPQQAARVLIAWTAVPGSRSS
jgi:hypothetical protein